MVVVWRYQRAGPIVDWLLTRFGYAAIMAPWRRVYVAKNYMHLNWLVKHELTHVMQRYELGALGFWYKILRDFAVIGYANSPLEIEARNNERKELGFVS